MDGKENVLVVKVDNSKQPNSRWYSGSGIYRNVRLVAVDPVHITQWGTYIVTPMVSNEMATVELHASVRNMDAEVTNVTVRTALIDPNGIAVAEHKSSVEIAAQSTAEVDQNFEVPSPALWSLETPHIYKAVTEIFAEGKVVDTYETPFGIRYFYFDIDKGFSLNGKPTKILGVCLHHDLGSLGSGC